VVAECGAGAMCHTLIGTPRPRFSTSLGNARWGGLTSNHLARTPQIPNAAGAKPLHLPQHLLAGTEAILPAKKASIRDSYSSAQILPGWFRLGNLTLAGRSTTSSRFLAGRFNAAEINLASCLSRTPGARVCPAQVPFRRSETFTYPLINYKWPFPGARGRL
jgi:hypothetical protein